MAKIDPRLVELLKKYDEDNTAVWDCHGTWVAYHSAIERMAAKAGISFSPPEMIVNDYGASTVVVMVEAFMGDHREWSFGEVSPKNNKNAYPYAMAEKRAKDRVALKLLGMSGLVYSEEEADDFKASRPAQTDSQGQDANPEAQRKSSAQLKREGAWETVQGEIANDMLDVKTLRQFKELRATYVARCDSEGWPPAWKFQLNDLFDWYEEERAKARKASEDTVSDIQNTFGGATVVNEHVAAE